MSSPHTQRPHVRAYAAYNVSLQWMLEDSPEIYQYLFDFVLNRYDDYNFDLAEGDDDKTDQQSERRSQVLAE
jgi:hypothetical protein